MDEILKNQIHITFPPEALEKDGNVLVEKLSPEDHEIFEKRCDEYSQYFHNEIVVPLAEENIREERSAADGTQLIQAKIFETYTELWAKVEENIGERIALNYGAEVRSREVSQDLLMAQMESGEGQLSKDNLELTEDCTDCMETECPEHPNFKPPAD